MMPKQSKKSSSESNVVIKNQPKPKKGVVIVITGPTGSGKSDLAIEVAKHLDAQILSADSRQLFKGMAIGTAQPSAEQLSEVHHHLIATHSIEEHYTAGRYEREAIEIIEMLLQTSRYVVVVGGSGLYVDALCGGLDPLPSVDRVLRESLVKRLKGEGLVGLLEQLKKLDPTSHEQVDRSNPKRVMRALEVSLQTGEPYSSLRTTPRKERSFDIIKIATSVAREELYKRINDRVDAMIEMGLESEARALYPYRELNSLQTVGYREMFDYFDGTIDREEAIELIKRNSRRYAKRQMTWLRRDQSIIWLNAFNVQGALVSIDAELAKLASGEGR